VNGRSTERPWSDRTDDGAPRLPDPRMIEVRPPTPAGVDGGPGDGLESELDAGPGGQGTTDRADAGEVVRPFVVTSGRTRPVDERLRVETLVAAEPAALSAPLAFESLRIVELCQRPVSVAELAASLDLPIGVTRVLVADLVTEGLVAIDDRAASGDYPSRSVLERVRDRVRAL
jgi:Protein of unknown function (DUF742)